MPPKHHGALVIFGSGPGIGVHVASRFARGGFEKVVLVSRDADRLRNDAFIVYSTAPRVQVSTVAADLASPADVQRALRKISDVLGDTPVECIHYNAAKASRTTMLEESEPDLRANIEVGRESRLRWIVLVAGTMIAKSKC
jgi:short-subunit dehydrogenase